MWTFIHVPPVRCVSHHLSPAPNLHLLTTVLFACESKVRWSCVVVVKTFTSVKPYVTLSQACQAVVLFSANMTWCVSKWEKKTFEFDGSF